MTTRQDYEYVAKEFQKRYRQLLKEAEQDILRGYVRMIAIPERDLRKDKSKPFALDCDRCGRLYFETKAELEIHRENCLFELDEENMIDSELKDPDKTIYLGAGNDDIEG